MQGFTVFLIDDDIDDQEIFMAIFGTIAPEARVITAVNGQVALSKLMSGEISPDVIFLDLNMPLMNGKQFLKEINKVNELKHIPIIILTTSSDQASKESVMELGARDFVTKPDRFSEWEAKLDRTIKDLSLTNR
jgi:CheY-like chemotaxis protein